MSRYPIPSEALDDRLGIVGTAGSGKTYAAGTMVERLLRSKTRVIVLDPLDVWWGLRLLPDGKPSPFDVVIFGGAHGDLPLTEHAGALVGETVARMSESAIVSLGGFTTGASERRFMLAFLTALYRHTPGEPVHVVFDEADMWAPQKVLDKEGDANKLLGMMETLVRRGRVKGFIPWLITQRPAVLSKNVLSQIDALVAMKLTSSQDRDAIGAWVEGSADKAEWLRIWGSLPAMQRGQGLVWVPGRGIMETVQFPAKATFDSSRTPKRGEAKQTAELAPIDISALKDRLATVEAEVKANDPKVLRAEIAALKRQVAAKPVEKINAPDPQAIAAGRIEGEHAATDAILAGVRARYAEAARVIREAVAALANVANTVLAAPVPQPELTYKSTPRAAAAPPRVASIPRETAAHSKGNGTARTVEEVPSDQRLSRPQQKIVDAVAWWIAMGHAEPTRVQVAVKAGMKCSGGHFKTRLSELHGRGLIRYVGPDRMGLTPAGEAAAAAPDMGDSVVATIKPLLSTPQLKIFNAMLMGATLRAEVAAEAQMDPAGGHFKTRLSELSTFGIVTYPDRESVSLAEWVRA